MGRTTLTAAETVVITGVDAKVQFHIGASFDPERPDQEFDVYVSIKHLEDDRVLIDRMYVCKVTGRVTPLGAGEEVRKGKRGKRR